MSAQELVRYCEIGKVFGKKRILERCSFAIGTGEIVGLVGPNGSGKTTLMKLLVGLLTPTSGTIKICPGIRIRSIIEEPRFYLHMTAMQNIEYLCGDLQEVSRSDMFAVVKQYAPELCGSKKVGRYSLGMRQKLAILYTMIGNPDLFVYDEPLNGLDPLTKVEIRNLIKSIAVKRQASVLISSHDLAELQHMCDRVIFLDHGTIVKEIKIGVSEQAGYFIQLKNPKDCYKCKDLLIDRYLVQIKKNALYLPELTVDGINALLAELIGQNIPIEEVRKHTSDLERIYLESYKGEDDAEK